MKLGKLTNQTLSYKIGGIMWGDIMDNLQETISNEVDMIVDELIWTQIENIIPNVDEARKTIRL
jgi:hypothetical protein